MVQYLQAQTKQMFPLLANIANSGGSKNSIFNFMGSSCFVYMRTLEY